jgi:hypothetical protein
MSKRFNDLGERLLQAGVAPRHMRRYLRELADHLSDLIAEEERAGHSREYAESAALQRLGTTDNLAKVMIERREFQAWSVRAPLAVFSLVPAGFLAIAWFVALLILWTGWKMFMPQADSPFDGNIGPLYGIENAYFQTGRAIYFGAPVFAGWVIGMIAVRQRMKPLWPVLGAAIVALIASAAQVHASRTEVLDGIGHISMNFTFGSSAPDISSGLTRALVTTSLGALPYLIWRLRISKYFFA